MGKGQISMIYVENTPNNTGVAVYGDHRDFEGMYEVLWPELLFVMMALNPYACIDSNIALIDPCRVVRSQ